MNIFSHALGISFFSSLATHSSTNCRVINEEGGEGEKGGKIESERKSFIN